MLWGACWGWTGVLLGSSNGLIISLLSANEVLWGPAEDRLGCSGGLLGAAWGALDARWGVDYFLAFCDTGISGGLLESGVLWERAGDRLGCSGDPGSANIQIAFVIATC